MSQIIKFSSVLDFFRAIYRHSENDEKEVCVLVRYFCTCVICVMCVFVLVFVFVCVSHSVSKSLGFF